MQSGLGQYFIPGSSIKGAIKTAVLYHLLKNETAFDLDGFVAQRIGEYQSNWNPVKFKEIFAEPLLVKFFQSVRPQERTNNPRRKAENQGPFTDFFRAIKVKDSIIEEKSVDTKLFAKAINIASEGMILQNSEGTEILLPFKNITGNLPMRSTVKIEALTEVNGQLFAEKYTKVDEVVSTKLEFYEVVVISLNGNSPVERHRLGVRGNRDNRVQCFVGETTLEISLDHEILESFQRGGLNLPFAKLDDLIPRGNSLTRWMEIAIRTNIGGLGDWGIGVFDSITLYGST